MKLAWIIVFGTVVTIAIVAVVVLVGSSEATDRERMTEFFEFERPPTHGGQEMQPRWGGN